LRNDPPRVESE